MKTLLICPDERKGVGVLSESFPLSNVPLLGESLLEYWLAHLATLGAREVLVLAVDRPNQVSALVGDGARWGLRVTVQTEKCELTVEEARSKYQQVSRSGSAPVLRSASDEGGSSSPAAPKPDEGGPSSWLPAPNDIILLDHLPGLAGLPLLASYADWFAAARDLMPRAVTPDRVGVRELEPGVWVGLHAHVASGAKLISPCWIGEHAWIETGAVIGPNAVLEKEVVVSRGAEIAQSLVGPRTFVGQFTEIHNSIAWGNMLINWERDSCLKVPDEFLLCSLQPQPAAPAPAKAPSRLRLREYVGQWLTSMFAEIDPPR